jgi:hypothetical protein
MPTLETPSCSFRVEPRGPGGPVAVHVDRGCTWVAVAAPSASRVPRRSSRRNAGHALAPLGAAAAIALAAGALAAPAAAQSNGRPVPELSVVHLADGDPRPRIDGLVDDEIWMRATPWSEFVQQDPDEGRPATERTEVRLLLDRSTLYIGIIAFDSEPDKIVVTQSRRDADLTDSDSVQVILDTFNDNQNGFVFGTNPSGIEYDGQVAGEGQTGGFLQRAAGARGSQRGQISGFNPNWDGDWTVRSATTARGWETEMAIPLRTLRYAPGTGRTWGFNVMRRIRRKNELVFLSPIPRGYDLNRVSLAAKVTGLDLPPRRDIKAIPFVAARADKDYLAQGAPLDRSGDVGLDVKWGITPSMTLDVTANTDFAQVEADDEQINLTRFPLFFPEKRGFFLENASTFQFGVPQQIDLFFSRRIGLSASGVPIGIIGGARLSGKAGPYNVGLLTMQTEKTTDPASGALVAPGNNFSVARLQREVGRSTFGAIFVNRQGVGAAAQANPYNRAYGVDAQWQATPNGKLFTFLARSESPGPLGADYAGAASYAYANPLFNANLQYQQVGDRFNAEVGFVPRRGYRSVSGRYFLTYQPKSRPWIRRFSPHVSQNVYYGFDGKLQSSFGHYHFFEIQPSRGGRFGVQIDRWQDRPLRPFVVFSGADGRRVVIPPALYTWYQVNAQYFHDPSAPVSFSVQYADGGFYDGETTGINVSLAVRSGSRFSASVGLQRDDISLPYGNFVNTLVPVRVSYSFTPLATLQALIQYNSQTAQVSSNVRLALLDRSGTGLFLVYNERRDTTGVTSYDMIGRSFVVKYTRLFDF